MVIIGTIITALLFLAVLLLHELGHLLAYQRRGFPIVEMGLGMAFAPQLKVRSRLLPFPFAFSPWLIGAYVLPEPGREKEIERLPYPERAVMYGAGVAVNVVIAGVFLSIYASLYGRFLLAGAFLAVTIFVGLARKLFCAYLIPVLGVAGLVTLAYGLIHSVGQAQGPLGVAEIAVTRSFSDVILKVGAFSLTLALVNAMPLFPLDGGRVADTALRQILGDSSRNVLKGVTAVLCLALVVYSFASDIASLVH